MLIMTEREAYMQIFSPLAEKRIRNNECPNCGKPKSQWDRRTDWRCCSVDCTKEFWRTHDKSWSWGRFRMEVFKRDKGVCQMCKKKFTFIGTDKKEHPDWERLVADHIKPLAIGGSMWDMGNLQSLCKECNIKQTRFK